MVFLDYLLPGTTALENIENLKLLKNHPKIVVISGKDIDEVKSELGEHHKNVIGFLGKPFEINDIKNIINNFYKEHAIN